MSELYKRIEYLCSKEGINITIMCKEAGVSRGSITDLKNGRSQKLSTSALSKIAEYFGKKVDYFIGTSCEIDSQELYTRISFLCDEQKISIEEFCNLSGLSYDTLSGLKDGTVPALAKSDIIKVTTFFKINRDYLFGSYFYKTKTIGYKCRHNNWKNVLTVDDTQWMLGAEGIGGVRCEDGSVKVLLSALEKEAFEAELSIQEMLSVDDDFTIIIPVKGAKEKAPTLQAEDERNLLRMVGRNGSYVEKRLTDEQLAALTALIDQLPEAEDI